MITTQWTQEEAVELCKKIESICPTYGCHVALTGGLLYKEGPRKDCDILFYRIRQRSQIDCEGLFKKLKELLPISLISGFGWCYKVKINGKNLDIFFPEEKEGLSYEDFKERLGVK